LDDSNTLKRWEILAVLITGVLKFVLMDWLNFRAFYIAGAILFWIIFIYKRYQRNPEILQKWGFRKESLKQSLLWLSPFAILLVVAIVVYGFIYNATFLNWHFLPVLLLYPVWGLFQQFMIAGLVAGNLAELPESRLSKPQAILVVSVLFALIHYPSLPLMIYVLVMESVFLIAYFRWNNLWALGLYHGIISSFFLFFVLGRDLFTELWAVF